MDGGERGLIDRGFRKREEDRFFDLRARLRSALGLRVEAADGFDLVAEKIDAIGAVGFGGIDVEDATAAGVLAGHFDHIGGGVADDIEALDESVGVGDLAAAEYAGEIAVEVERAQAHGGGLGGRDDDQGVAGMSGAGELPQGDGALFLNLRMGRHVLEGKDVVRGEFKDGVGGQSAGHFGEGLEQGQDGVGGFVVGDDEQRGSFEGAHQGEEIKRLGGGRKSGERDAVAGVVEVMEGGAKGGRLLRFRQHFTHEGKNHSGRYLMVNEPRWTQPG